MSTNQSELVERYAAVQSAMVADTLDGLGVLNCTLPPHIRPLVPNMKATGPAFTIRGRATPEPVDRLTVLTKTLKILRLVPAQSVVVVEANDGSSYSSHVGEFHATFLQTQGVAATITSGGARDAAQIERLGYPVFSAYNTSQDGLPRWQMIEYGVPIMIGSVTVNPGDFIVADTDGVVVVPSSLQDKVIEQAESFTIEESLLLKDIKAGMDPLDALRNTHGGPWSQNIS